MPSPVSRIFSSLKTLLSLTDRYTFSPALECSRQFFMILLTASSCHAVSPCIGMGARSAGSISSPFGSDSQTISTPEISERIPSFCTASRATSVRSISSFFRTTVPASILASFSRVCTSEDIHSSWILISRRNSRRSSAGISGSSSRLSRSIRMEAMGVFS